MEEVHSCRVDEPIMAQILARFFNNKIIQNTNLKSKTMSINVDVVIETPKGSSQKYDYVQNTPFFKLSKILPVKR
jgi:hypothetical protein